MQLYSTNHQSPNVSFKEAIFRGLPPDNGLYMPTEIPVLPASFFETIDTLTLPEIAYEVCQALLGDEIPADILKHLLDDMLNFPVPIVQVEGPIYSLELIHGPSHAFKDFGARFMARIMSYFLQKEHKDIHILVATSGDTGSAVAQGFLTMKGIKVTILYPSGKVSDIQEKQLTTLGHNITALEIDGTFDDCQRLVKQAFLDPDLTRQLSLSSANSINIARLIPQSFYYFYAYAQLKHLGKPIVFCTPSGNFGNLCGGLIAQKMGLPVYKFVAATNANNVVPEYLSTSQFVPRSSVTTLSNAMDVGNPSNFYRLVDLLSNDFAHIHSSIEGRHYSDEETLEAIKHVFHAHGYVMCPHTAIGYLGARDVLKKYNHEEIIGVFLATAHPAKFMEVLPSEIASAVKIPRNLSEIAGKTKSSIPMSNRFEDLKSHLLK